MKKTLGGDRLGAGKKMEVELKNFGRSTHDKSHLFKTTMSPGTIVPFWVEITLPGDTWDIDLECDVKTHPTVGPLFGSYKAQLDIFEAPLRLYQGMLHNNKLGIGMKMNTVKLPKFKLYAVNTNGVDVTNNNNPNIDADTYQINPSSILAYLGIMGVGTNRTGNDDVYRDFFGGPLLMYWDVYKNYYANKQEDFGVVIHTPPLTPVAEVQQLEIDSQVLTQYPTYSLVPINVGSQIIITRTSGATQQDLNQVFIFVDRPPSQGGGQLLTLGEYGYQTASTATTQTITWTGPGGNATYWNYINAYQQPTTSIQLEKFELSNIDDMREAILSASSSLTAFDINATGISPYSLIFEQDASGNSRSITFTQEGLGLKTYQSDLLNNWLRKEWIEGPDGISAITAIDTSGGSFTIDTLNLSKKVYDMLNQIAVSGGTYDDWLDAVYTQNRYTRAESPIYHGGLSKEVAFQEVVSNAESADAAQPLGTLAGKAVMTNKHKGGQVTINSHEPGILMGMVSLTPRLDYSQGNDWYVSLESMDDLHKPHLDEIGFEDLITERMAWWDTEYLELTPLAKWVTKSAGKQPAWINYMTSINRVRGNFAIKNNESFMVLRREYKPLIDVTDNISIYDLTTYVDPRIYNQIFADTSLDSQNFWVQIQLDISVRRKISARLMPNL